MFRVAVTDYLRPPLTIETDALSDVASVEGLCAGTESDLDERFDVADGLIVYHEIRLTAASLRRLRRCRVLVRGGVGVDNVDLAEAQRRGIVVCNVPDYGIDEVADHAIGLMIDCVRRLTYADRRLSASPSPWGYTAIAPVFRLAGAMLGVIGLGRIGTATALRAQSLRMHVVAYDPYIADGRDKAVGVRRVELDELLASSDVVSIHTPLTDETRGMIGRAQLAAMKRSAVLVNTARGAIVDTDALADALETGSIAGAGIDVLPQEPPPIDGALMRLWRRPSGECVNLVVTPHCAFYSEEAFAELRRKAALEVRRVLKGEAPRNPIAAS